MVINNHISENKCVSLIISPRLKHKVDKYVRYVSVVNVVLFTKTSIESNATHLLGQNITTKYLYKGLFTGCGSGNSFFAAIIKSVHTRTCGNGK